MSLVGGAVRCGRFVIHPVFVLVGGGFGASGNLQNSERRTAFRYANFVAHSIQDFRWCGLIPSSHEIASDRHIRDHDLSLTIGNGEIRSVQRNYHRAHFGVNIAEDIGDSRTIEADIAGAASFVQSKVESLPIEQRKHVMEEGIAVGELDNRAHWHNQNMRLETLIVLGKTQLLLRGWFGVRRTAQRSKPNNYVLGVSGFRLALAM